LLPPVAVLTRPQVLDAQLCGDAPAGGDPSLYPSDHIGIKATLRITRLKE
jgi:hypothetical protein